jgi:predicted Rossmann fold flavoprotein
MAEAAGHKIIPPKPGLVPLRLQGQYPGQMEGLSLDGVRVTFSSGKKKLISKEGSIIFTSTGISGPLTLQHSAKVVTWLDAGKKATVKIDIIPQSEVEALDRLIREKTEEAPLKSFKNTLKSLIPARLADVIIKMAEISPDIKNNKVTHIDREKAIMLLKGLKFNVDGGDSFEKAHITCGGVSVKDIDPRTMASKKVSGLYFAGEVIDIDGESGGFNLQAAFSTGYLAGVSAAKP